MWRGDGYSPRSFGDECVSVTSPVWSVWPVKIYVGRGGIRCYHVSAYDAGHVVKHCVFCWLHKGNNMCVRDFGEMVCSAIVYLKAWHYNARHCQGIWMNIITVGKVKGENPFFLSHVLNWRRDCEYYSRLFCGWLRAIVCMSYEDGRVNLFVSFIIPSFHTSLVNEYIHITWNLTCRDNSYRRI